MHPIYPEKFSSKKSNEMTDAAAAVAALRVLLEALLSHLWNYLFSGIQIRSWLADDSQAQIVFLGKKIVDERLKIRPNLNIKSRNNTWCIFSNIYVTISLLRP